MKIEECKQKICQSFTNGEEGPAGSPLERRGLSLEIRAFRDPPVVFDKL